MKRNLPGPFTFILSTTSSLPKIYKKKKTVGIRIPDNNIIREIVAQLGNPVLSTTIKDKDDELEYTTDPELIHEKWSDIADIVIDGGIGGIDPSTVVDCTSNDPIIVRQGKGELNF
jgi:tRNA threonylcarbamoyl adenosine modification protein (Sua5/YciO/YrdC/YwlC family)